MADRIITKGLFLVTLLASTLVVAAPAKLNQSKAISQAEEQKIIQHQLKVKQQQILRQLSGSRELLSPEMVARPFSDHEQVKYVFFSAENSYDAFEVKKTILKNLPSDVTAVIFADTSNQVSVENYRKQYAAFAPNPEQVVVISAPNELASGGGSTLWARDNVPIPVFSQDGRVISVNAKYYRYYEGDQSISKMMGTKLISHDYYYEGGNFQVDDDGTCVIVNNSRHKEIPDDVFTNSYGCKRLKRLVHLSGIGHADERIKILKNKVILTDTVEYKSELEDMGYQVVMVPKADRPFETYINALAINDTVFLPVFKEKNDSAVIAIYEQQGFKVIPVYVNSLPNQGRGSIHCITMTYPEVK